MSEQPKYGKGDTVAIVTGKGPVGTRGEIFWSGPNKFGPGFRYGMKDEHGSTHWVDESDVGPIEGAPPPPPPPEKSDKPALEKGTRVELTSRESKGVQGEVFWVGDSKFGSGHRYGVRDADGETHWVDEEFVEVLEAAPKKSPSRARSAFDDGGFRDGGFDDGPPPRRASSFQDGPPPDDDAPFSDDDALYEDDFDDAPF